MPIERDWNYKMNNETIKYYIMEIIKNSKEFGGERPLFATHDFATGKCNHSYRRVRTERMQ